jgi:hypothetical protein
MHIPDRHADYVNLTRLEAEKIRGLIIEKFKTYTEFCNQLKTLKASRLSVVLRGEGRISPKGLAKIKVLLGIV